MHEIKTARKANTLKIPAVSLNMECVIDTQARREGPAVFESARLEFVMAGLSRAQAQEFVDTYKRH